jgi:hypothetical protein
MLLERLNYGNDACCEPLGCRWLIGGNVCPNLAEPGKGES